MDLNSMEVNHPHPQLTPTTHLGADILTYLTAKEHGFLYSEYDCSRGCLGVQLVHTEYLALGTTEFLE